ncbi:glutamine amidotransferase [Microbacterium sp. MYb62]|uniref:glutamine amidotransferase n=1 Tax=Microbacterium sp. MYb62 TaxID=1848690 RepID=UPI000CFDB02F|nr:glutamine amidotransferase [Microbacterium sp. MYb62]PRB14180.1 glutamine amidotransferase [Microbacterium sp. MYb62]
MGNLTTRPRTALAFRHVHFEDLGIIEPLLRERGYHVEYLDLGVEAIDIERVDTADLLIVLGGPFGVHDTDGYPLLHASKEAVAHRLRDGRPLLGICLGAQLVAEMLGAEVRPTGAVEIGYAPLDLTDEGRDSPLRALDGMPVLHWHGDAFTIPEGAQHLARTPGFPNQAFRIDSVLALQFHLEADHRTIGRWLIGHAHELHHHGIDPRSIREDARTYGPKLEIAARAALGSWLDDVESDAPTPTTAPTE